MSECLNVLMLLCYIIKNNENLQFVGIVQNLVPGLAGTLTRRAIRTEVSAEKVTSTTPTAHSVVALGVICSISSASRSYSSLSFGVSVS